MEDMYICLCNGIKQSQIEQAIKDGTKTLDGLRDKLEVAVNCCACEPEVIQLLLIHSGE